PMPPGASYTGRVMPPSGDPSRTMTPSRANAAGMGNTTMWQGALRSLHMPTVSAPMPPPRLWSGNIGRLWMSEIASTTGDVVLGVGVTIWFMQVTRSFPDVALLLLAFAVPALLVSLLAGSLASVRDMRRLISLLDLLRIALAGLFVLLYFDTILPIALLLAFGMSLSSNMRSMARRGAIRHGVPMRGRTLLASGDQLAAGIISVAGPALATLLFILNGERIFSISLGAVICYILTFVGESQVEPLPDKILYQRPANDVAAAKNESVWEDEEDEDADSQVVAAERKAPVWELEAPPNARAALSDVNDGLRIAGTSSHALVAIALIALLAAAGGVLAAVEPFYVWLDLNQVPYVLGLFFTATGLGATLASAIVVEVRAFGRFFLVVGALAGGVGLNLLLRTHSLTHGLILFAVIGAANVFAIRGGQMALLRHFLPAEQRAVASAMTAIRSIMPPIGILAAIFLVTDTHFGGLRPPVPIIGMNYLLLVMGMALVVAAVVAAVPMVAPNIEMGSVPDDDEEELDDLPEDEDADDSDDYGDPSRRMPASRRRRMDDSSAYSQYMPARSRYDDASAEYEAPPRNPRRPSRGVDDGDDDPSSSRRGRSPGRW
ncbi:MAG TPA: MFS transporter, partial [Ktedonobacterales bacterium]|nr:MFS transporter [Ktedonobacterales bacterium]